jgi:dihydroflavonol-4-reductase
VDFVAREGGAMELTVVNPVGSFGPALPDHSASIAMVQGLLQGRMRAGTPRLWFAVVDVRDVADLQLRAMADPAAAGERFLGAAGDSISMHDIATILREHLGDAARLVPAGVLPDAAVRAAAADDPAMGSMLRELAPSAISP